MSETKQCPQCQAEIPAGAPEGLCPSCLLKAGLQPNSGEAEPKTAAYTPTGSGFVPPPPQELQPAFPQLEILELLGKGGMGAVYKAKQRGLDRLVAVKILPPEYSQDPAFAERFMREAKALAMLSHPNIVGVHDVGQAGGFCYFVMEYVDGVNLRQAMRSGELKSAEALKIVPQICDALQFAHDEGIVHRDIKPENILLDKKGRVKIADFGLAKLLGKTAPDLSLTGTQQVMGTLHYMAPEQFEGSRNVDHRADIYSLGVTFYEMLTGELPIGRFAVPSKKVQIDVRLDEVVLRSLEKEPEQRYQHASEIKTEVEGIVSTPAPAVALTPAAEDSEKAYFNLPPGQRVLVDYYLNAVGYDLEKALAVVAAMDELDRAVLENYLSKILAIKSYREKTGAGLSDAKAAVEAIAKKHGVEFPPVPAGAYIAAAMIFVVCLATLGIGVWVYHGLSPIIAIPIMLLLATPNIVKAWKKWGTPGGAWSVFWAIAILFFPVVIPVVGFLADPEPTLNHLYALTGATPGPHDALFFQLLLWGGLIGLLFSLAWFLRKSIDKRRSAEKQHRNRARHWTEQPQPPAAPRRQPASEFKTEMDTIARGPIAAAQPPFTAPSGSPARTGYLRTVLMPCAVLSSCYCLVMLANLGLSSLVPEHVSQVLRGEVGAFLLIGGGFLVTVVCLSLNGIWLYRATASGGYLRNVVFPLAVFCMMLVPVAVICTVAFRPNDGIEYALGDPRELAQMGAVLASLVFVVLNGVWLCRTLGFGVLRTFLPFAGPSPNYLRDVFLPVLVLCFLWLAPSLAADHWGDTYLLGTSTRGMAAIVKWLAVLAFLSLNAVWVYRKFGPEVFWKFLPFAWTFLCVILFVMLWTPYETYRANWSGYLDGGIWPYREINECAISLEPVVPTCKRIVIREKTELDLSGNPKAHKGGRQPDADRTTRLAYDIELLTLQGDSRHLQVDALNGKIWEGDVLRGSILDSVLLADWLQVAPEEHLRDKAVTLQARAIVDIIQRASRDPYVFTHGGTREFPGGNYVSGAGVKISRLENAANQHGRGTDFRNEVFKYVPGWNAAESVKSEPVVPILYVGVPLMLAVWAIGVLLLLLMLRRQHADNRKVAR